MSTPTIPYFPLISSKMLTLENTQKNTEKTGKIRVF